MKHRPLLLALTFLLTQVSFAAVTNEKPNACPSVSAIKTAGFSQVDLSGEGWFLYNSHQQYDTNAQWSFGLFIVNDTNIHNENEAREKANVVLNLIKFDEPRKDEDKWVCSYMGQLENNSVIIATAATPPYEGTKFFSKYRR
jgi:hypothetical protein